MKSNRFGSSFQAQTYAVTVLIGRNVSLVAALDGLGTEKLRLITQEAYRTNGAFRSEACRRSSVYSLSVMFGSSSVFLTFRFHVSFVCLQILMTVALFADQPLVSRLPENHLPGLVPLLSGAADYSDTMRARQFLEDKYDGERLIGRSLKRPRLSTTLDARKEDIITESGLDLNDRAFYTVTLRQPVFHWGALESQKRSEELDYDIIKLGSLATFRSLLLDIRSKYISLLIKNLEIEQHQQQYERRKANVEYQRERKDLVSLSALETLEIELSQLEIAQIDRRSSFDEDLLVLASSSGMDTRNLGVNLEKGIPEMDSLSQDELANVLDDFRSRLDTHPSILQLRKDVEVAALQSKIVKSRLKPKVNITSGLTQFSLDDRGVRRDEELAYAGLEVRWNIFDGYETEGHRRVALSQLQQAELTANINEKRLERDLDRLGNRLQVTADILANQERNLERTKRNVEHVREDFQAGRASQEAILNAEQVSLAQEIATQKARGNYLNYLSELTSLVGLDPFAQSYWERQNN